MSFVLQEGRPVMARQMQKNGGYKWGCNCYYQICNSRFGGEGGIRTRDTAFDRILAFQASTFNHSVTSPVASFYQCPISASTATITCIADPGRRTGDV